MTIVKGWRVRYLCPNCQVTWTGTWDEKTCWLCDREAEPEKISGQPVSIWIDTTPRPE